ncbi:MAG: HK97 family phage prohead protease [Shinella sp.]|uniref:HK97 family phage prohead protease n=1 Tax=Shinella sp. TaxID=1870904 RepID=UPI004037080D
MWFTESGRPPRPGSRTIAGYAIQWNVRSSVRPDYDEVFIPYSLHLSSVTPLRINHDRRQSVTDSGGKSFRLRCDDVGLWVEFDCPPDTEIGDRLLHGSRFGGFSGWSIAFRATQESWDRSGEHPLRVVHRANLGEVSIVDRGAHVTTLGVAARMASRGGRGGH